MTPAQLLKDKKELTRLLNLIRKTHDLALDSDQIFMDKTLKAFVNLYNAIQTWNY